MAKTQISITEAQVLSSPNPFALVVSVRPDGEMNLAAVSWWTYVSNHPPMIAVALSKKGLSGECITAEKVFSLCIPDRSLAKEAFYCGTVSGRKEDKAAVSGIALERAVDGPAVVRDSRVALKCRLTAVQEAGDHMVYIAQVEEAFGDETAEGLKAYDGYKTVR